MPVKTQKRKKKKKKKKKKIKYYVSYNFVFDMSYLNVYPHQKIAKKKEKKRKTFVLQFVLNEVKYR